MQRQRKQFISVIIPAYNNSARILPTLVRIDEYCRTSFKGYEIIVVNDGSQDATGEIVLRARRNRRTGEAKLKIKEMGSRYLFICLYIWLEKYLSRGDYMRRKDDPNVELGKLAARGEQADG